MPVYVNIIAVLQDVLPELLRKNKEREMKKLAIYFLIFLIILAACGGDQGGQQQEPDLVVDEGLDISMGDFNLSYKVYVSPLGITESDGSIDNPFKTVKQAINYVTVIQDDESIQEEFDLIEIVLLEGMHETDTINITPDLTKNLPVCIRGEDGKRVILSAGEKVSGTFTHYSGDIYKINVGTEIFREIYVNGKKAIRSRYPNADSSLGEHGFSLNYEGGNMLSTPAALIDTGFLATVDMNGVELNIWRKWVNDRLMVQSATVFGNNVVFQFKDNTQRQLFFDYPYPSKNGSPKGWLENSLAFIDQGGEWYHDRTTGDLYYKLREGESIEDIEIILPRHETIFRIKGISDQQKISNLTISNLEISHTSFVAPTVNDGMADTQSIGYLTYYNTYTKEQIVNRTPGAIELDYAQNIFIEDNIITNLGSTAISIGQGNETIVVQRNKFECIGKNAVESGYFNEYNVRISMAGGMFGENTHKYLTRNVVVQYNYFHDIGSSYVGSAVLTGYMNTLTVVNNEIDHTSYSGMAIGWGWTRDIAISGSVTVKRNKISNVLMGYVDDGAAIYLLGKTANDMINVIEYNYIMSDNNRATGIYFDQGVTNYVANNNVLIGQFNRGAVYLHDKEKALRNITVTNTYSTDNVIYHTPPFSPDELTERSLSYEDIVLLFEELESSWPQEVRDIMNGAGLPGKYRYLKD